MKGNVFQLLQEIQTLAGQPTSPENLLDIRDKATDALKILEYIQKAAAKLK